MGAVMVGTPGTGCACEPADHRADHKAQSRKPSLARWGRGAKVIRIEDETAVTGGKMRRKMGADEGKMRGRW